MDESSMTFAEMTFSRADRASRLTGSEGISVSSRRGGEIQSMKETGSVKLLPGKLLDILQRQTGIFCHQLYGHTAREKVASYLGGRIMFRSCLCLFPRLSLSLSAFSFSFSAFSFSVFAALSALSALAFRCSSSMKRFQSIM